MTKPNPKPRNINTRGRNRNPDEQNNGLAPEVTERLGIPVKTTYVAYATGNSTASMKAPVTTTRGPWE